VYRAGGGCHARYMLRAYGPRGAAWQRLSPRHAVLLGMERRIFGDPSQVVLCNSAMVEAEIRAEHGVASERMVMIPNGVDLARFHPDHRATLRDPTRARIGAGDAPAWLLLGSGFARKGVDTALRALAAARSPRSELWIAGGDEPRPWRDLAESLGVASRTRFLGPRDDAPALCAAADGLLLPTRYDAFANACLEAAAAGLPVVTSGANGAAGFLGEAARVVADPEDVEGFAHALDSLDDAAARRALGAAARQRAETASWERHVQALRALYQRLPS